MNLSALLNAASRVERELKRTGALDVEDRQRHEWLAACTETELDRVTETARSGDDRAYAELAEQLQARIAMRERLSLPHADCLAQREPDLRLTDASGAPLATSAPLVKIELSDELAAGLTPSRPSAYRDDADGRPQLVRCTCLLDALDAVADLSRADAKAVRRDCKRRHAAFVREAKQQKKTRAPRVGTAVPTEAPTPVPVPDVPTPKPAPVAAKAKRVSETPTKRFRAIKKTPRWYDPPAGGSDAARFRDTTF